MILSKTLNNIPTNKGIVRDLFLNPGHKVRKTKVLRMKKQFSFEKTKYSWSYGLKTEFWKILHTT